ncbi:hypothetical protein SBADM41S_07388 [Streptomyces badius]
MGHHRHNAENLRLRNFRRENPPEALKKGLPQYGRTRLSTGHRRRSHHVQGARPEDRHSGFGAHPEDRWCSAGQPHQLSRLHLHRPRSSSKRLVRFMAKESVFRHRISGPLMRGMKHIPVDRKQGEDAYAHALRSLRSGEIVGVVPRGHHLAVLHAEELQVGCRAPGPGGGGSPRIPWHSGARSGSGRRACLRNFSRSHIPITIRVGEPVEAPADQYAGAITRRLRGAGPGAAGGGTAGLPGAPEGRERHLVGACPTPWLYGSDPRRGARTRLTGPLRPFFPRAPGEHVAGGPGCVQRCVGRVCQSSVRSRALLSVRRISGGGAA